MKWTERILYLLTFLGFCLKPFHLPWNTMIILFCLLGLFIFYLFVLISGKQKPNYVLTGMCAIFITFSILSHIKFFAFSGYVMDFAAFILFLTVYYSIKRKTFYKFQSIVVIILIIVHCAVLLIPKHKIYYTFNIKYNHHIEYDYKSWDNYSWFLFIDNKYKEASDASKNAQKIVMKSDDTTYQRLIGEHFKVISDSLIQK
jgi:hypothetical protein